MTCVRAHVCARVCVFPSRDLSCSANRGPEHVGAGEFPCALLTLTPTRQVKKAQRGRVGSPQLTTPHFRGHVRSLFWATRAPPKSATPAGQEIHVRGS